MTLLFEGVVLPIFLLCAFLAGLVAFAQLNELRDRVTQMELALWRLKGETLAAHAPGEPEASPAPAAPPGQPHPAIPVTAAHAAQTPPAPPRRAIDWELLAGGRLLNVLGAIVLVIGVGLLLKYAFDQNWIDGTKRVLGGLGVGAAMLWFGDRSYMRSKGNWSAQGVLGAGLGILYLSGYASFQSYHLVPFVLAYAFMAAVTVLAFLLALRYDSLPVAMLGWFGGFVTPLALGDAMQNELLLGSYVTLLDIGITFVALARPSWFGLQPFALVASYVVGARWFAQYHQPDQWFVSTIALLSLWGVFFAYDIANVLRSERRTFGPKQLFGIANFVLFALSLGAVLAGQSGALEVTLLTALAVYAVAYAQVAARNVDAGRRLPYSFAAGVLAIWATSIHFTGFAFASALAVEATIAVVVAARLRFEDVECAACVTALGALWVALTSEGFLHVQRIFAFVPVLNERCAAMLLVAAAFFVAGETLRRASLLPPLVARVLRGLGVFTIVLGATVETRDVFERALAFAHNELPTADSLARITALGSAQQLAISAVWILISCVLLAVGIRSRVRDLRLMAIALFDATILKAFFLDLGGLDTLYRIVAFIGLGLTLLGTSAVYQRLEKGLFAPPGGADAELRAAEPGSAPA